MALQLTATDSHLSSAIIDVQDRSAPCSILLTATIANWTAGFATSLLGIFLANITGIQFGTKGGTPAAIDIWTWGGALTISSSGIFAPNDNVPLHMGYTFDGTTHSLYVNGLLINTSTTAVVSGMLNQIFINGYPSAPINETSNSVIEDFAIYNRALSADEVLTSYTCNGLKDGLNLGLIARYSFDELPSGSTIVTGIDYSGHGFDLTPLGADTAPVYIAGKVDSNTRLVTG